jgi:ribonuclease J
MEQRKQLSLTGMISIVATLDKDGKIMVRPTIISKGFLYAKDNEEIFKKIEAYISEYFEEHPVKDKVKAKKEFEDAMQEYVYSMSKQKPSIFAIINQVA